MALWQLTQESGVVVGNTKAGSWVGKSEEASSLALDWRHQTHLKYYLDPAMFR